MVMIVEKMGRIVKNALCEIEECGDSFWLHDGAS